MKLIRFLLAILLIFVLVNILTLVQTYAGVRVKDIAEIDRAGDTDLLGYGLVIGLAGTGDSKNTEFTVQSTVNMLERLGVTVPQSKVRIKNVAAVMVTAKLAPYAHVGSSIDVTVSSLGDASTLEGGTLLLTPLLDQYGDVYAYAQGPLSIGGFNVQIDDNKIVNNYTLVGRIPNGATVKKEPPTFDLDPFEMTLSLHNPDFTTVQRVTRMVNGLYPGTATALDNGSLALSVPQKLRTSNGRIEYITGIEHLEVTPDSPARVVINERTGTIVAGGDVSIAPIALAHGNITVEVKTYPVISQPAPFSQGETVEAKDSYINVSEDQAHIVYLEERSTISEIAGALNAIGASPRDIIAIFQAIKQAGALRAELVIL